MDGMIKENPHTLFEEWLSEAEANEINDPTAMALATADSEGQPSVRMVLLKGHDERGFVFYTNLGSRKSSEITENPNVALLFHWKSLRRQVRVEGPLSQVTDAEADAYFASRARLSRIGAWASDQSQPLESRAVLEARVAEVEKRFEGQDPPRPKDWSGFRVQPRRIEFWQDGAFRLHDRIVYHFEDGLWRTQRLFP
ncbi:MAG: pyridoxamine 5'-phosphate oxidase [Rhodospirillales bacterium]|jgi:pyridoxamine 5'-phosphate oxidase